MSLGVYAKTKRHWRGKDWSQMDRTVLIICAAPLKVAVARRKPWMVPGALSELAAMVRMQGWQVSGWDETAEGPIPLDRLTGYALVMLTGLTPSYYRMNEIADFCKKKGIQLIVGGRDVIGWSREDGGLDLLARRFLSFCTTAVTSELMARILADCASGSLQQHYYLPQGTPPEFVIPDYSVIDPGNYFARYCVRSSSGCSRNCPWCTVGGQGHFCKPLTILKAELDAFRARFFLDTSDSFLCRPNFIREVVLPIYKASGMRWGTEAAISDLLGEDGTGELIYKMRDAGCMLLYIGVESITRNIGSKTSRDMAEEVIGHCQRAGIVVIGSLMLDVFGNETIKEIEATIEWATERLDFAQFSHVALLPGCAMRIRALCEGTIISDNLREYDGAHPTMAHALSPELRKELLTRAYQDFSTLPMIFRRAWRAKGALAKIGMLFGGLRYRQGIPQF